MMNFDYLKDIPELSALHRYCDAAERNQYADPEVSALNSRQDREFRCAYRTTDNAKGIFLRCPESL